MLVGERLLLVLVILPAFHSLVATSFEQACIDQELAKACLATASAF